ncbi:ABC transporter permease [Gordonia aichiensis]|uniref:ABC transporter permease n=1 Tax=Gordonia aichiensis TaxID=36820 RepID=UPI003264F49F
MSIPTALHRSRIAWSYWWPILTLTALAATVLIAPLFIDSGRPDFGIALTGPSAQHWAGTDHFGHDLAARTLEGVRTSLLVAAACALLATVIGAVIGVFAALIGGWVDALVMRIVDGINALPHLVLGVVIAAMWRGAIIAIIASIALTHWPAVARIVRAELLGANRHGWVEHAHLMHASRWFIARHHLFPAISGQLLVAMVVLLPHAIWHEATLSFLGVGLSPESASLGSLLNNARGDILTGAWWTLAIPGTALIVTALIAAVAAARLRTAFTPPEGHPR